MALSDADVQKQVSKTEGFIPNVKFMPLHSGDLVSFVMDFTFNMCLINNLISLC